MNGQRDVGCLLKSCWYAWLLYQGGIPTTAALQKFNQLLRIILVDLEYQQRANRRHPHSWSIVDNDQLIKWLLKQE